MGSKVDKLINGSAVAPIIILQGDHGVPRLPGWNDTIFNAYYLQLMVKACFTRVYLRSTASG